MKAPSHTRAETWRAIGLVIVILSAGFLAIGAQQPPGPIPQPREPNNEPQPEPKTSAPAISVETSAVSLDVVVTDDDGRILAGLKRGNFRVLDNGKAQKVTNFAPADAPITIAMLLEYSATAYNYFAYKSANWGAEFLNHLEPSDWVALVTYDMRPKIQVDFTRNKAGVRDQLSMLSYPQFSEANLFDAMQDTLDRLEPIKGKKSILLLSTGANTFSSATQDDIYKRLKQTDVTVFCVGVAEQEYVNSLNSDIGYLQSKNRLSTFADLTGGMSWFPRFETEVPDISKSVVSFLRSQYRIGFTPPGNFRDGKYHKLKVEIVAPDGTPLKVTDDKGKQHKILVYARQGYIAAKGNMKK